MKRQLLFALAIWAGSQYAQVFAQQWPSVQQEAKPGLRWWWLGSAVDKTNLQWNLKQYADHGVGAVEITPIYGVQGNEKNNIDYLSDRWMEMLRFVETEGKADSIEIDMATGTGWPFGGPWVPLEESCSKMVIENDTVTKKEYKALLKTPGKDKDGKTRFIGRYYFPIDKKHWRVINLWQRYGAMLVKRAAPGGAGWVIDHFNKTSVEHYLQHIEQAFERTGTPYPHTFFNDSYEVSDADYTTDLFAEFQKRRGYSLEENFDKLVDGNQKVVADYRETLGDLLLENFTQTWTAWAHRHGAITRNQAHGSPANLIDCYSAVDIPEIEGFGLTDFNIKGLRKDPGMTRKNDSDFSMYKWASSAAHINGKPFTSSETFTWLTEHFRTSLSQMKPDMDLMFCGGVNHMFFHGTAYSPKDDPWPGWKFYASVDMSPTNTIWRDAPYLMQYITRCQSFLQWGKPDNDFLVYVPVRDVWNKRSNGKRLMQFAIHTMNDLAPEFVASINEIDRAGYDCDYISERYLLTTTYTNGMLQTAAGTRYKALIIPNAQNILTPAVRQHIDNLKAQGAQIIIGTDANLLGKSAKAEEMKTRLGLKMIRRSNPKGYHYFIANLSSHDINDRVQLAVPFKSAMWFDPMNGRRYRAEVSEGSLTIDLKSGESMILETFNDDNVLNVTNNICKTSDGEVLDYRKDAPYDGRARLLKGNWSLRFTESTPTVDQTLQLDSLRSWEGINETTKTLMGTGVYECKLKFTKQDLQPSNDWAIDLGDVRESARVYVNDTFVGCAWAVPYVLQFSNVFKPGINTLRIEVTNLPANRISQLDREGYPWRKMEEINVVNINYKKTSYADWKPMASGLNSRVILYRVK
ncbi:MAG: glycosyl hydrolase family 2 [Prevotella sp.]|nr:glycosyl hydrolase family 2 [Prevotella sp.]